MRIYWRFTQSSRDNVIFFYSDCCYQMIEVKCVRILGVNSHAFVDFIFRVKTREDELEIKNLNNE